MRELKLTLRTKKQLNDLSSLVLNRSKKQRVDDWKRPLPTLTRKSTTPTLPEPDYARVQRLRDLEKYKLQLTEQLVRTKALQKQISKQLFSPSREE